MVTSSSKINKLFSEIDVNYKKILIQNHFPYVFTKSFYFLEDGLGLVLDQIIVFLTFSQLIRLLNFMN